MNLLIDIFVVADCTSDFLRHATVSSCPIFCRELRIWKVLVLNLIVVLPKYRSHPRETRTTTPLQLFSRKIWPSFQRHSKTHTHIFSQPADDKAEKEGSEKKGAEAAGDKKVDPDETSKLKVELKKDDIKISKDGEDVTMTVSKKTGTE